MEEEKRTDNIEEENFEEEQRTGIKALLRKPDIHQLYEMSVEAIVSLRKKKPAVFFSLIFVIFVVPPGYYLSSYAYHQYLLSTAEEALENKQYQTAKKYFADYHSQRPGDTEALLEYVRVLMELGEYNEVLTVMGDLPAESAVTEMAEYSFYLGLANVGANRNDAALERVNQGLEAHSLSPSLNYLLGAYRLFIEEDAAAADELLSGINILNIINRTTDGDIKYRYEADLNLVRDVMSSHVPEQIAFNAPPPFRKLGKLAVIDDRLGFSLPLYAYNSAKVFNMQDIVVQQRGVHLSGEESVRWLRAMSALLKDDPEQAGRYLAPLQEREENNLMLAVLSAYAALRAGDIAVAREIYREVAQRSDSPNLRHFYATTEWYGDGGDIPENQVIAVYEYLIEKEPENLVAVSNLAFLKIYQNNLDEARELLTRYASSISQNEYILVNAAILDIAEGRLETAADNLRRFVIDNEEALPAKFLLAQVFIRQGKHLEARSVYEDMKQYDPTPLPYLEVANFYEKRVRWQLMTDELRKAQEAFKDDAYIVNELLIANALAGDEQQVSRLLFVNNEDEAVLNDYRSIIAQALVSRNSDEKEDLFTRAWYQATAEVDKNRVAFFWARSLLDEGKINEAKSVLRSSMKTQEGVLPVRMQALALRLNAQDRPGFPEEILSPADSLLNEDYKLDVLSRLDIAWAYVFAGEGNKAIDLISNFGEEQKRNRNALVVLKTAYESVGDRENAEKTSYLLATGRELQTSNEDLDGDVELITGVDKELIERINRAAKAEDYPALIQIYTEVLEQDKVNRRSPALTYQNRGAIYLVLEQFERAEADFSQALAQGRGRITPSQLASILYNYGYALTRNEKVKEGLVALRESVALDGENVQSLSLLAQLELANQDYEGLIVTYNRIIEFKPEDKSIYLNLAKIYRITGKNQEGIDILLQALKLDANHRQTHILLAELYAIIGDQTNAQKHLDIINRI